MKKLTRIGMFPTLVALILVGAIAAAPATPVAPAQPTVVAASTAGTLNASWPGSEGATFYDVGWANHAEIAQMQNAGREWLDAFHFATIPAQYTNHAIQGLQTGVQYYVIIGAKTARFGGDPPVWSPWSDPVTTSEGQVSDCLSAGTCTPIHQIGSFGGSGDSAHHIIDIGVGLHRVTSSHRGPSNFIVQLINVSSGRTEYLANEIGDADGVIDTLVVHNDGASYRTQAGNFLLQVQAGGQWTVLIERIGN